MGRPRLLVRAAAARRPRRRPSAPRSRSRRFPPARRAWRRLGGRDLGGAQRGLGHPRPPRGGSPAAALFRARLGGTSAAPPPPPLPRPARPPLPVRRLSRRRVRPAVGIAR